MKEPEKEPGTGGKIGTEEWLKEISEEGRGEKFEFEVNEEEERPETAGKETESAAEGAREKTKELINYSKSRIKRNARKTAISILAALLLVGLYLTGQMLLLTATGTFIVASIYCYFFWRGIITADMTALIDFDFENAKTKLLMIGNKKAEEEFDLNVRSFHHDQFATRVVFTKEINQEEKEIVPAYCHNIDTLELRENEIALEDSRKVAETKIEENARLARNKNLEVRKSIDEIRKTVRESPRKLMSMDQKEILKWAATSGREGSSEREKEVKNIVPKR